MTPAIQILKKQKIEFQQREYSTTDDNTSGYGVQATEALGQNPQQVFKTLMAVVDGDERKPVVAVIPVARQLDLKKVASHLNGRKAKMANPVVAERASGYIVGGISPIGQKQSLKVCLDSAANEFSTIFISGGKRGLQLELTPADLIRVVDATVAVISK